MSRNVSAVRLLCILDFIHYKKYLGLTGGGACCYLMISFHTLLLILKLIEERSHIYYHFLLEKNPLSCCSTIGINVLMEGTHDELRTNDLIVLVGVWLFFLSARRKWRQLVEAIIYYCIIVIT